MNTKDIEKTSGVVEIDLMHILSTLWKRAWIIVLAGCIFAAAAFAWTVFAVEPQYSASTMLYVNNSMSLGSATVSISDLNASKSLVNTYIVILKNRTTLEEVIENTSVPYTYEQLSGMISAAAVNDTEIFRITVTTNDPYEAAAIANEITNVLPRRVEDIVEGASMKCVDHAVVNTAKVSPSISRNTLLGLVLGIFAACAVLAIISILDDTIHDEEHLLREYEYPVLAKIPDLFETSNSSRYAYYQKSSSSKSGGDKA